MPASRSSSAGRPTGSGTGRSGSRSKAATRARRSATVTEGLAGLAEQLVNGVLKPLDAVLLTHERIQETLEEAAERGRLTRSDANELVAELFLRGRQQTDDVLGDLERLVGTATRRARKIEPVDRIVRGADRARRSVGVGPSFPIIGYDDLTARQVLDRLGPLRPAELRRVRDYERRHANRKSVLGAVEKSLG
jgi:polyhydroxyalkanoate synthesis regulator phasin